MDQINSLHVDNDGGTTKESTHGDGSGVHGTRVALGGTAGEGTDLRGGSGNLRADRGGRLASSVGHLRAQAGDAVADLAGLAGNSSRVDRLLGLGASLSTSLGTALGLIGGGASLGLVSSGAGSGHGAGLGDSLGGTAGAGGAAEASNAGRDLLSNGGGTGGSISSSALDLRADALNTAADITDDGRNLILTRDRDGLGLFIMSTAVS